MKNKTKLEEATDQAVSRITRKAHPFDQGTPTAVLEEMLYWEIERLIDQAKYEQKMKDVRIIRSSGWYWGERLVRRIILWQK